MYVVLNSLPCSLCRSLEQRPHIDIKTTVGIAGSNHFRTAVMTVLPHFGNHYTGLATLSFRKFLSHGTSLEEVGIILCFA